MSQNSLTIICLIPVGRSILGRHARTASVSRLDDKRTGAIVIVMQRVHIDDLTGFVLSQSDEWEILNLPAIADAPDLRLRQPVARARRRIGFTLIGFWSKTLMRN